MIRKKSVLFYGYADYWEEAIIKDLDVKIVFGCILVKQFILMVALHCFQILHMYKMRV